MQARPGELTMDIYHFEFRLDGIDDVTDEVADRLFEAGCDDATPGRSNGEILIGFSRSAPSIKQAILSAIADVHRAGIGARVVRVIPEHPSESDARLADGVNTVLAAGSVIQLDPELRQLAMNVLEPVH
jgi:hypothetical protein